MKPVRILMMAAILSTLLAEGQALVNKGVFKDHTLRVPRDPSLAAERRETDLQIRELSVDAKMPVGKSETGRLRVLYAPEEKLYQWNFVISERLTASDSKRLSEMEEQRNPTGTKLPLEYDAGARLTYVGNALVTFTIVPSTLFVRESRDRADSLEAATDASLKKAAESLGDYLRQNPNGKEVPLRSLGRDFYCTPPCTADSAIIPIFGGAKITSASLNNGHWEVIVKGSWTAKVVLNAQFDLVEIKRLE